MNANESDMKPPCEKCNAACCRQYSDHKFASALYEDEENLFPEAKLFHDHDSHFMAIPYKNGKCIHLMDDDKCGIYDRRPRNCREFNCIHGYLLFGSHHGSHLDNNPHVVELIQLAYPDIRRNS